MKRPLATTALPQMKRLKGHGPGLMWFRNDLRIHDNPALSATAEFCGSHPLHAFFLLDYPAWRRHDMAAVKADFIMRTLHALAGKLNKHGIQLRVIDKNEAESYKDIVAKLCKTLNVQSVFWNAEYEVDESKRDNQVADHITNQLGIPCCVFHDQCIVRPGVLRTKSTGQPFTVFTPFKKAWIEHLMYEPIELANQSLIDERKGELASDVEEIKCNLDYFRHDNQEIDAVLEVTRRDWPAGEEEAIKRLDSFIDNDLLDYKEARNMPDLNKTSKLSAYLSIGSISARRCFAEAFKKDGKKFDSAWINELCWRDFYRHIVFAFPRVSMGRPFKEDTIHIPWRYMDESDEQGRADFEKWCKGQTGCPLVDAAMRCLLQTGWMHNRLRMVTAMFLTKHLLVWWPRGESFFMQHLIDGDLASNNGGWQWSASTGTDAQPYFRIFNPTLQSERFDGQGAFIKQWIPELRSVDAPAIHSPFERLDRTEFKKLNYAQPIVEHKAARERCLAAFRGKTGREE